MAPIIATNYKIVDRIHLVQEMQQGLPVYKPSQQVAQYLNNTAAHEIALKLPSLLLAKVRLDNYAGEVGEHVKCDFSGEEHMINGEPLTLEQR